MSYSVVELKLNPTGLGGSSGFMGYNVVEHDGKTVVARFGTTAKEAKYAYEYRDFLNRSPERRLADRAVDSERAYQRSKHGVLLSDGQQPTADRPAGWRSLDEWILYIYGYAHKLAVDIGCTSYDPKEKLDFIRKVAGLSVVAMEQHGAPRREGF